MRSIVYQQLHGKAAAAILARLCQLFAADQIPRPEQSSPPPASACAAPACRGSKTAALQDLARRTADGLIPSYRSLARMSDDTIVERLPEVRGIGRWSVEMLLLFRMGRPDVWPTGDFAVRKSFGQLFKLDEDPSPRVVEAGGERWRPFRSAAAWYLWRALDKPTTDRRRPVDRGYPLIDRPSHEQ